MNEDLDGGAGKRTGRVKEGAIAVCKQEEWKEWLKPLSLGLLDAPGVYSASAGSEGHRMFIFLKIEGDRVTQTNFQTSGCTACSICGFFTARLALGKSPEELGRITGEDIIEFMGGLPERDRPCAFLASEALGELLRKYRMRQPPKGTFLQRLHLALVKPVRKWA